MANHFNMYFCRTYWSSIIRCYLFYYVGFGEQDEKNETKKEVFSGVGEALEIAKNGSFYQCGLEIPLEADGNIWGDVERRVRGIYKYFFSRL